MPQSGARVRIVMDGDAEKTIGQIAKPQTVKAATAIAEAAPGLVPTNRGVMRRLYTTTVAESELGARVGIGSPFWHWLEYGTAYNPPYRPAENAVRGLGIRYEAK